MPLTVLLLVLGVAEAPPPPAPEVVEREVSVSAGPSRGGLFGLRLAGWGLQLAYGPKFARDRRGWAWGLDLGGGIARTRTPAGLAVTDVALEIMARVGGGPARAGAGAALRLIDVERTSTDGALRMGRVGVTGVLALDVLRRERATAFVELRGRYASDAWIAQAMTGVRL